MISRILPSLDDYACLICTSIAFKPIRLNCGHLFCVRCLVKMQKQGKDECPLCRSKVVLLADKSEHRPIFSKGEAKLPRLTRLDADGVSLRSRTRRLELMCRFMKSWFPKEVKEKQRENDAETAKEQALEAGMDTRCIIM